MAVLAANVPAMYELHFSVPMAGAVLCTFNTRHDAAMLSTLLKHSEAKVFYVESHFLKTAQAALQLISQSKSNIPLLITISDSVTTSDSTDYEALLLSAPTGFEIRWPLDECDPISLNYTSGTTSRPKGVIYSHRGAYLNTLSTLLAHDVFTMPVLLWTVPMFHCNGWCLAWGMAAQGGVNICMRNVTAKAIFDNIAFHKVTHLGGAPTVLNMVINSPFTERKLLPGRVIFLTGGAPPPPKVLSEMEKLGFQVNHLYGLTETYGPATTCTWRPEWDTLPPEEKVKLKALQGLHNISIQEVDIKDPVTMKSVPNDGCTMGEVMFRGNAVMSGYYKDPEATKEVMKDGWLRSGDLGVKHPIGYIQLKDRSKDIIISGGENISTIEVEAVIYSHPAILEAAVVARPDEYWGETPCAFVKLKDGFSVGEKEIIEFCRDKLPHYMAPRSVVFSELPKTSTGKIQKFVLRGKAKAMGSLSKKGISKL